MSKPIKELMKKDLADRFAGVDSVAICDLTGLDAQGNASMRGRLEAKGINVSVVKNSVARHVFRERGDDDLATLFEGPCAVAWGGDSVVTVVRELIDFGKETPGVAVKSAMLSGDIFRGEAEIEAISNYPTREEAIGQVVQCVISCGAAVASALIGPSGQIASLIESVEKKASDAD